MNRRQFLSLVAGAPVLAALKPWRPDTPQTWHAWKVPEGFMLQRSTDAPESTPLTYLGEVQIRPGESVSLETLIERRRSARAT